MFPRLSSSLGLCFDCRVSWAVQVALRRVWLCKCFYAVLNSRLWTSCKMSCSSVYELGLDLSSVLICPTQAHMQVSHTPFLSVCQPLNPFKYGFLTFWLCALPTWHHREVILLSASYVLIPPGNLCKLIAVSDFPSMHTFVITTQHKACVMLRPLAWLVLSKTPNQNVLWLVKPKGLFLSSRAPSVAFPTFFPSFAY